MSSPIPKHFKTLHEAEEFWATHSAADYWDEMEEVDMEFSVRKSLFLIPIDGQVYRQLKKKAAREGRALSELINELLLRALA
jgi:hypothetical protein